MQNDLFPQSQKTQKGGKSMASCEDPKGIPILLMVGALIAYVLFAILAVVVVVCLVISMATGNWLIVKWPGIIFVGYAVICYAIYKADNP